MVRGTWPGYLSLPVEISVQCCVFFGLAWQASRGTGAGARFAQLMLLLRTLPCRSVLLQGAAVPPDAAAAGGWAQPAADHLRLWQVSWLLFLVSGDLSGALCLWLLTQLEPPAWHASNSCLGCRWVGFRVYACRLLQEGRHAELLELPPQVRDRC